MHAKYKDVCFIVIRGTIHQEQIACINICALKLGAPKYIKPTDLKGETSINIIIVGARIPYSQQWTVHPV